MQISRDISLKFPTSGYNDYMRIQRMRGELDSLKSSDLKVEIEKLLGEADGLQKKGDLLRRPTDTPWRPSAKRI